MRDSRRNFWMLEKLSGFLVNQAVDRGGRLSRVFLPCYKTHPSTHSGVTVNRQSSLSIEKDLNLFKPSWKIKTSHLLSNSWIRPRVTISIWITPSTCAFTGKKGLYVDNKTSSLLIVKNETKNNWTWKRWTVKCFQCQACCLVKKMLCADMIYCRSLLPLEF